MKIILNFLCLCLLSFSFINMNAQTQVQTIESKANATVSIDGSLSDGAIMQDLSWAWNSQNACFVKTKINKFSGNHVLFETELPRRAEMFITVIPKNKKDNFSIYAYSKGSKAIVPDLARCVSCEAEFKWDMKKRGKTQDHTRTISLRAIGNPYHVVIGVVGAEGLTEGDFTLEIRLEGGEEEIKLPQEEIPFFKLESKKGQSLSYNGNLSEGVKVHDLSWAWNSQNACFVSIRKSKFTGNHILYATELPRNSEMTIKLKSKDGSNMSLYAYSIGKNGYQLVPNLRSCVSCEADFEDNLDHKASDSRTISLRATGIPYNVVIGVAGAEGLQTGEFTLEVSVK